MVWIILLITSTILFIYALRKYIDWLGALSAISGLLSIILSIGFFSAGVTTYPNLLSQYQQIKALHQRADDIKNALYPEQSGKLIAGSLTNLQQSSRLSEYLRLIAESEAKYNASLAKARFYKTDLMWILFGHGLFISNKVFQLPEIRSK